MHVHADIPNVDTTEWSEDPQLGSFGVFGVVSDGLCGLGRFVVFCALSMDPQNHRIGTVNNELLRYELTKVRVKGRFPLPLGSWDELRYFIVALPEPSI